MDSTASRKLWAAAATAIAALTIFVASVPSAHGAGYVRPRGASPFKSSLVPVFERCDWEGGGRRSDTVHGGGLRDANGLPLRACRDPEQVSGTLTIGTPDANGKAANSVGNVQYSVVAGKPATPADEADVRLDVRITDVRLQQGLGDYPGELELEEDTRITDSANGPGQNEPGTLQTFFYYATIPCTATPDTTIGATCELHTTMDTLVPNTIKEGKRMIWASADHTHIFDGGPDWKATTRGDNLVFMTGGLFVP